MKRGRFGPLVGVIHVSEKKTRFLIYAAGNAEILTIHEVPNEPIIPQCGWLEYNPLALFANVVECIDVALNNLQMLDIDPKDVIGLAVTNQRETCLLWDRQTGEVLSNAIAWNDTRTTMCVRRTLKKVKNQSSYLQEVCGLPLSTCFSAFKVKWLCESSKVIREAVQTGSCCFGTLDSWIIWNLTGGSVSGGTHVTDVTNASRTMYFNLETCSWDKKLCEFFKVNMGILPKIKSCSEVLGYVHDGPLRGIGIYGCITEQQGALLGQFCFRREQVTLHFNADVHLLVNTGREIIQSDHNMLSTVAFQLGSKEAVIYALEGLLPGSGSSVDWLNRLTSGADAQNPLQLLTLLNSSQHSESIYCSPTSPASTLCGTPPQLPTSIADGLVSTSTTTAQFKTATLCGTTGSGTATMNGHGATAISLRNRRNIFFVPARDQVLLPGCGDTFAYRGSNTVTMNGGGGGTGTSATSRTADPTLGLIYGVTKETTGAHLVQAAFEGICFQVKQMLRALHKDCKSWHALKKVTVGGDLIEANAAHLAQTLADFCDVVVEYPQTESVSALGAMIAAGLALNVFTVDSIRESMAPPTTIYQRSLRLTETEGKYRRWEALQLAIWEVSDGEHSENEDDDDVEEDQGSDEAELRNGLEVKAVRKKKVSNTMLTSAALQAKEERYKDPLYNVQRSIPGTMFATIAFATLLVAEWWQQINS